MVSPGSRNAPLVLALHHHPDIAVHVTIDERAAAHHALGLALATWTPVPVVCTSGTAALNHGPALAEAFHARIPLLSITADRPQDVVGRGHGQTLTQTGVHAAHVVHHDVLDESIMDVKTLTQRARQALHRWREDPDSPQVPCTSMCLSTSPCTISPLLLTFLKPKEMRRGTPKRMAWRCLKHWPIAWPVVV